MAAKLPSYYIETAEGLSQMYDRIDEILDSIDTEKIAKVMRFLNWQWAKRAYVDQDITKDTWIYYQPTSQEIRKHIRDNIIDVIKTAETGDWHSSCGGIDVRVFTYDPDDPQEEREEIKNGPDDFEHRVEILVKFVIEENFGKYL